MRDQNQEDSRVDVMLNHWEANQPTQISETLYEVYSKIHRVTALTLREHQILYTLQQDPFLNEEHRDMLNRIFYKLNRTQRRRQVAASVAVR